MLFYLQEACSSLNFCLHLSEFGVWGQHRTRRTVEVCCLRWGVDLSPPGAAETHRARAHQHKRTVSKWQDTCWSSQARQQGGTNGSVVPGTWQGGGQTWLCSGGLEATRVGISVCVWGGHFSLNKLFFGYLIILLCTYLLYFLDLF